MIRMLSGLIALVIGWLERLFKRDGKVSAYRIVLATTLSAVGVGLWAGWVQWVLFGEALTTNYFGVGFGVGFGTFLARWVVGAWLVIVLLWPLAWRDVDDLIGISITMLFLVAAVGTMGQVMYTHGAFTVSERTSERTHYRTTVSCEHCGASCYVNVVIGESWTDWEYVECCKCGIKVSTKKVPEYGESREAWDARVRGTDGAED